MADTLAMALSKVLFEHEPKLLVCDLESSARAAAEVSNLLGCIMATVLTKCPDQYPKALERVASQVHLSAIKTVEKAENTTPHLTTQ